MCGFGEMKDDQTMYLTVFTVGSCTDTYPDTTGLNICVPEPEVATVALPVATVPGPGTIDSTGTRPGTSTVCTGVGIVAFVVIHVCKDSPPPCHEESLPAAKQKRHKSKQRE